MIRKLVPELLLIMCVIAGIAQGADASSAGVVNINTATAEQLQLLPRVGPALANRIVEFRTGNGEFAKIEEIVAVKGIGERAFENLKPYLTVSGETTLTSKVSSPRRGKS